MAVSVEIQATRAALVAGINATRADLSMADRRLGDTLARADTALRTLEALRNDVKPAIDGAVALEYVLGREGSRRFRHGRRARRG